MQAVGSANGVVERDVGEAVGFRDLADLAIVGEVVVCDSRGGVLDIGDSAQAIVGVVGYLGGAAYLLVSDLLDTVKGIELGNALGSLGREGVSQASGN